MGLASGAVSLIGGMGQAGSSAQAAAFQAQQARVQSWNNRRKFEHQEFLNKMNIQIKNREIAQANAARWMQNRNIASAANKNRAEEDFWIRWNFDNDTNMLSVKGQQVNNTLLSSLDKRNISFKSANARQLLRSSLENTQTALMDRRLAANNQMRSSERKQMEALSKRDFSYNSHVNYIPGLYLEAPTISPEQAAASAYSSGMTSALMGGISSGLQGAFMGAQMETWSNMQNPVTPPPTNTGGGG